MKCGICSRKLNNPDDPLSLDCGGHCRGCMIELGDTDTLSDEEVRAAIIKLLR